MPISFTELHSPQLRNTFQLLHPAQQSSSGLAPSIVEKQKKTEPTQVMLIAHSNHCKAILTLLHGFPRHFLPKCSSQKDTLERVAHVIPTMKHPASCCFWPSLAEHIWNKTIH